MLLNREHFYVCWHCIFSTFFLPSCLNHMLYEQAVARRPGLLVDIEKPEPMLNYNILLNHIDAIFDQDIDAMPALSHPGYGLLKKMGVPDFLDNQPGNGLPKKVGVPDSSQAPPSSCYARPGPRATIRHPTNDLTTAYPERWMSQAFSQG
ncbi:hypothetical protein [Aeromonas molluscorum]|uniref:Uncharacterized protein n=1 Tax=Aeromonas molluscorum 848 TaxID=1268236 RepID=R1FA46_9GAMM|nr:hypothetical protein [Aeromonas molluscorum]EOD56522.1 hypothetical protein G113_03444 [Aeromonas molluscorum 848]